MVGGESSSTHGLNRAQRIAVTVTLRQLERALQRIVPLVAGLQQRCRP
jgi:hypothetical protein